MNDMTTARRTVAEKVASYFAGFYTSPDDIMFAEIALVFGRNDSKLVDVAATLNDNQSVGYFVVTGGKGKDSGDLPRLGLTEAGYLGALMRQRGIVAVIEEYAAENGGQNCRNSIALMREEELVPAADDTEAEPMLMVLIAHWASLYRLYQVMETEGKKLGFRAEYRLVPTLRPEELSDGDVDELIAEFRRLIDWPGKQNPDGSPFLDPVELPADLVAEANALQAV